MAEEERSAASLLIGLVIGTVLAVLFLLILPIENTIVASVIAVFTGAIMGVALRGLRIVNTAVNGLMRSSMLTFNVLVVGAALFGLLQNMRPDVVPLLVWFITVAIVNLTIPNAFLIKWLEAAFPDLDLEDPERIV